MNMEHIARELAEKISRCNEAGGRERLVDALLRLVFKQPGILPWPPTAEPAFHCSTCGFTGYGTTCPACPGPTGVPTAETGSAATVCARTGCDNEAAKGSPSCRFHTDNPPTTDPRTATVCVWCLGGGILLIDGEPAGPCRDCNVTGRPPASSREG